MFCRTRRGEDRPFDKDYEALDCLCRDAEGVGSISPTREHLQTPSGVLGVYIHFP